MTYCVRRRRTLPNRHVTARCYVNSRFSVYVAFASLSCRDLVKELVHVALLFILRLVIDFSEFGNCERVKSRSQIYFYACRIFKFCSTQFLLINTGRTHLANLRLLLVNKYLSNLLIHSQAQRDSGQD